MVYAGSASGAVGYFSALGLSNPDRINPADYYLDIVQRSDLQIDWKVQYFKSLDGQSFMEEVTRLIEKRNSDTPVVHPSFVAKLWILIRYFALYFIRERGAYINRFFSLAVIGMFGGTFFFNLKPITQNIQSYTGATFFSALASLFMGIAPTALFAKDRSEAVERVKNGIHPPGVFVLAQFIVSSIYNIPLSLVFTSVFYWISKVNTTSECFLYFFVMNWCLLGISESALLVVVETVKNDFLSVSAGIVFIGSSLMLAGFNRPVNVVPVWCSWLCYIIPLKVFCPIYSIIDCVKLTSVVWLRRSSSSSLSRTRIFYLSTFKFRVGRLHPFVSLRSRQR